MAPPPPHDLAALLSAESAWLHRLARSLLDEANAADLAQDAAVVALRRRPDFGGDARRARSWLHATAQHLARAIRRRGAERQAREASAGAQRAEHATDERLDTHELLVAAVKNLPEPYRSAVVMRFFEDRSTAEIAALQGISAVAVRQRISRALAQLRTALADHYGEHRWRRALVSTLPVAAAPTAAGLALGGMAMHLKKFAAAAGLLAVVLGSALYLHQGEPPAEPIRAEPTALSAQESEEPDAAAPSPERASLAAEGLRLHIVDDAGQPAREARAFAWRDGEDHHEAQPDAQGTAHFPDLAGRGSYLVTAYGYVPVLREAELDAEHRVVLERGGTLQGRVTVDGHVPEEPVELTLQLDKTANEIGLPSSLVGDVPSATWTGRLVARTGPDGVFSFRALPGHWEGTVTWPSWFAMLPSAREWAQAIGPRVAVNQDTTDLALELAALPYLRVRVVWEDTQEPIVGVGGDVSLTFAGYGRAAGGNSDPDGLFRFPLCAPQDLDRFLSPVTRPPLLQVRLRLRDPALGISLRHTFHESELRAETLTFPVPRPRITEHVAEIVDEAGAPIDGAVVSAQSLSRPTNPDGRTTIAVKDGTDSLLVGARGHAFIQIPPPDHRGTQDRPWRFTLPPGNSLLVRVHSADTSTPQALDLAFQYTDNPFIHAERNQVTSLHRELSKLQWRGARGFDHGRPTERWETTFSVPPSGEVFVPALEPGVSFTLELRDLLGTVLARTDVLPLGPTENRTVDLHVPDTGRSFEVTVLDTTGRPLPSARARVHSEGWGATDKTDRNGLARISSVHANPAQVKLTVTKQGYGKVIMPPPVPSRCTVTLARTVPFTVSLRDPHGTPAEAQSVTFEDPGGDADVAIRDGQGRYRFRQVWSGTGRLTVHLHGQEPIKVPIQTTDRTAEVDVPFTGRLVVESAVALAEEDSAAVELHRIESGEPVATPFTLQLGRRTDRMIGRAQGVVAGRYRPRWVWRPDGHTQPLPDIVVQPHQTTRVELPR